MTAPLSPSELSTILDRSRSPHQVHVRTASRHRVPSDRRSSNGTVPHLSARVHKQLMHTSAQRARSFAPSTAASRALRAACAHAIPPTPYPRCAGCPVLAAHTPAVLVGRSITSSSIPSVPPMASIASAPGQIRSSRVESSRVESSRAKLSQVRRPSLARDYLALHPRCSRPLLEGESQQRKGERPAAVWPLTAWVCTLSATVGSATVGNRPLLSCATPPPGPHRSKLPTLKVWEEPKRRGEGSYVA